MPPQRMNSQSLFQLPIEQLRYMAVRNLDYSIEGVQLKNKSELVSDLSSKAALNLSLRREINKLGVSIRPSFFLVNIVPENEIPELDKGLIAQQISRNIHVINTSISNQSGFPSPKNINFENIERNQYGLIEVQFTWQRIHWYWDTNVEYKHIYELRYGYAILNFEMLRGMLICQTQNEKHLIEKAIEGIARFRLTTQPFTKELLAMIGDYDRVKSAMYQRQELETNKPQEIRYTDEELSNKPLARDEETDPFSERLESFYRIPIGGVEEYGIGATSRTGKLWLPRMTPLETVRDFGIKLLDKVSSTVDGLVETGDYDEVLKSLGLFDIEEINTISPVCVREIVVKLVHNIANMIIKNETTRPFLINDTLAIEAAGNLFFPPVIDLFDEEIGSTARWRDENGKQFVKINRSDDGKIHVKLAPQGDEVDLKKLIHPLSGNLLDVSEDLYNRIRLYPLPNLVNILIECLHIAGSRLEKLLGVNNLPFVIANNRITLDLSRIIGEKPPIDIQLQDIREFRTISTQTIQSNKRDELFKLLEELGEECKNESAQNCSECLSLKKYACLRSIVASTSLNSQLVRHQGIELSDGEGELNISGERSRYFMFAKQNPGGQLTLKNTQGAKLVAQILDQVEKSTFEVVTVISPTPIADNLLNALRLLCKHFNKRLLILNREILAKFLIDFQKNSEFDNIDYKEIYKRSRKKLQ